MFTSNPISISHLKFVANPLAEQTKIKAFCSFTINDTLRMNSVRVVDGQNGKFLSYPSQKGKDGSWYSLVQPASGEVKKAIEQSVLEEYQKTLAIA
jgi:stage V sporulation protein G